MKQVLSLSAALCLMMLLSMVNAYAQIGVTVSLNGTVTPDQTLSTYNGASIAFVDPGGKENRTKTDNQGKFSSVILQPATPYTVRITGTNLLVTTHKFTTPAVSKFAEVTQNFSVMSAVIGRQLFTVDAFSAGSSQLTEAAKTQLTEIVELLKQNRGLSISLTMPKEEQPKVAAKAKPKKGKKSKDVVEEQAAAPTAKDINQERLEQLQQFLADVKSRDKRVAIVFEGIVQAAAAVSTQKKPKKKEVKASTASATGIRLICSITAMNNI